MLSVFPVSRSLNKPVNSIGLNREDRFAAAAAHSEAALFISLKKRLLTEIDIKRYD